MTAKNTAVEKVTQSQDVISHPIKVGRATTIKVPYTGATPTYTKPEDVKVPQISVESLNIAKAQIVKANEVAYKTGKSVRNYITDFYNKVFEDMGGVRGVEIAGLKQENDKNYIVTINKNAVGKVISDTNLSAEKLAIFDNLDGVVESGEYVGSGKYTHHGGKVKNVIRYDYFEALANIDGRPYLVSFDVEVIPGKNNYRTHKTIKEINLTQVSSGEVGPEPTAQETASSLSDYNIPQPKNPVNSSGLQLTAKNTAVVGEKSKPKPKGIKTLEEIRRMNIDYNDTTVEKVTQSEENYLANFRKLVDMGIAGEEEYKKVEAKSSENIAQAQRTQINIDYQRIDADSSKVRREAINNGYTDMVSYVEMLANQKGIQVKYYNVPNESFGNGMINSNTMYINTAKKDTMFSTAVHETGHAIKKANEDKYNKFLTAVSQYAQANDEFSRYSVDIVDRYLEQNSPALASLLNEDGTVNKEALQEELALKLAEELIKSPEQMLEMVSRERSIVDVFLDFVRGIKNNIAIMMTSSERAMLNEAERTLVNFMRGEKGKSDVIEREKYSVEIDSDGKPFIVIDEDILKDLPKNEWENKVKEVFNNKFPDGIDMGFFKVNLKSKSKKEFLYSEYSKEIKSDAISQQKYMAKMQMINNLDEIVKNAYKIKNESPKHERKDKIKSFNRGYIDVRIDKKDFSVNVVTAIQPSNREIFYDIVKIAETKIKTPSSKLLPKQNLQTQGVSITNSKSQKNGTVNSNYMQNNKKMYRCQ